MSESLAQQLATRLTRRYAKSRAPKKKTPNVTTDTRFRDRDVARGTKEPARMRTVTVRRRSGHRDETAVGASGSSGRERLTSRARDVMSQRVLATVLVQ
jgi:hypothetical protein